VADGHDAQGMITANPVTEGTKRGATSRISKFSHDGKFVKSWGGIGVRHGEFRTPTRWRSTGGRLGVADRGNHRIEIGRYSVVEKGGEHRLPYRFMTSSSTRSLCGLCSNLSGIRSKTTFQSDREPVRPLDRCDLNFRRWIRPSSQLGCRSAPRNRN
jgi:hypothetical protein